MSNYLYKKIIEFYNFLGIDNVSDPIRIPYEKETGSTYLKDALNVDISDNGILSRSDGSILIQSGNYNSFWSNGKLALCMGNGILYKVTYDNSQLSLYSLYNGLDIAARMQYVEADDKVFMTNGSFIGYYDNGVINTFQDPNEQYKVPMPPGYLLEFFDNQLFVSVGSNIIYSDAAAWNRTDYRRNFIPFISNIQMMKAVESGMWVSDLRGIYYLDGRTASDFTLSQKLYTSVYPGGYIKIPGNMLNRENIISGEVVIMLTSRGIYLGGPNGLFEQMAKNIYIPSQMDSVSSFMRFDPILHQVIFVGKNFIQNQTYELELTLPTLNVNVVEY